MILSNQVRCHKCGGTPFSAHRHDFQHCGCGSIAVDGGMAYLRRAGDIRAYDEMSIIFPDEAATKIIYALDQVIGDGRDYSPTSLLMAVERSLAAEEITVDRSRETYQGAVDEAFASAVVWTAQNRRNGLGALCAVARYVRDAGGVWKVPADA